MYKDPLIVANERLTESFDRLCAVNSTGIDDDQVWRNVGAVGLGVFIDPDKFLRSTTESAKNPYAQWDIGTEWSIHNEPLTKFTRHINGVKNCMDTARVTEIDDFHALVIAATEDISVRSIHTRVTLNPYDSTNHNVFPHIDSPLQTTTNRNIGKLAVVVAVPGETIFLRDGIELTGRYDHIFSNSYTGARNGTVNSDVHLHPDDFEAFAPGELVLFGSKTTVHAMPLIPELQGVPRVLARSLIEINL